MSLYKNWFTTEMLRDALQGGANSTSKVTFKRMVASEDVVSDKDFPGLTNASMQTIKENQTVLISSTKTRDNVVTITSVFNSFKVISEYKMNTVYLVAEYNGREFLAAITSANEPYTMPVESKTEHAEYTFKLQIGISNTQQVDLNMDPSAVATNAQLMAVEKRLDNVDVEHTTRIEKLEKLEEGNVKLTSDQVVYGAKKFVETIIGTIKRALVAVKLENARNINGVPFDGTEDIVVKASNDDDLVHKTGSEEINGTKTFTGRTKHLKAITLSNSFENGNNARPVSLLEINAPSIDGNGASPFKGGTFHVNPAIDGQLDSNYTLGLQSGGTMIVGAGEAATAIMKSMQEKKLPSLLNANGQSEQLILVSDEHVFIGSGYQEGGTNGQWIVFDKTGNVRLPGQISATRFQGNADTATKFAKAPMINGVPFDGSKNINIPVDIDSGWKELKLTKDFEPYDSRYNLLPIYKVRNGILTIHGTIKPTRVMEPGEQVVIATLPKEAIPNSKFEYSSIQQASGVDKWNFVVQTNGDLVMRRHAGPDGAKGLVTNTWLPFSVTCVL